MWIKSEGGEIFNLVHARSVELFPSGESWQLVAHFVGDAAGAEDAAFVPLCAPRPEKEAQHIMERICGALDGKDNFLDIARIR